MQIKIKDLIEFYDSCINDLKTKDKFIRSSYLQGYYQGIIFGFNILIEELTYLISYCND